MIWYKDEFVISDDKDMLDTAYIHDYLSKKSYWAENIPMDIVRKSIDGSLCFGIYDKEKQIGFARVVTDKATLGYLADVFVDEKYRGKGLSKWLMEAIMSHPQLQCFRRWMLGTRDAHGLYSKFGFEPLENPQHVMHKYNPDLYAKKQGE